ncbi:type II toxin-antitoxin system RelE/ParE family toxin [Alloalcanivorax venustensis]|jgi:plasmid stabilization system protein ParE|uniref:type II toxin-antitoxin system RelE/ParE family toxin n=1 Tax=Alloalcanivorax venustensis TaxID=172371 RepID=UPI003513DE1C
MELRVARSALEDLKAIQAYYADEGVPHIGDEFVTAILEDSEILRRHPDVGRAVPEFGMDHIRERIHPPFRVVYLRTATEVVLIRVWRSERQLELPNQ